MQQFTLHHKKAFCGHVVSELKLLLFFCLVREIKITKHLADTEVDEDSDAVFTCEVNYADEEAQWLLNDKVLFTNEVNTITQEGKVHKLMLKNLAPKDGGTITFQVRKVKESVTLKVKGKNSLAHNKNCSFNSISFSVT